MTPAEQPDEPAASAQVLALKSPLRPACSIPLPRSVTGSARPLRGARFRLTALLTLAAANLWLTACSDPRQAPIDGGDERLTGRLVLTGSSTVAPLAAEIARRFEGLHPGVRIDVQSGGSSQGIADVRRGSADIGMISRALRDDERDLDSHLIAIDGITIVVHRDNPIQSLTDEQIVAIYTGRARSWAEVGGRDAAIVVANKAEGRATLDLFLHHFRLTSPEIRADVVIGDNQHGIRTILGEPRAIAYVSIGTAEYEVGRGLPLRLLPMNGIEPTSSRVRDGSFPLSRPLNLVTRGHPTELVRAFLNFATSSEVDDLVTGQFFVPTSDGA